MEGGAVDVGAVFASAEVTGWTVDDEIVECTRVVVVGVPVPRDDEVDVDDAEEVEGKGDPVEVSTVDVVPLHETTLDGVGETRENAPRTEQTVILYSVLLAPQSV